MSEDSHTPFFAEVFSAEAMIEFKRYLSGLIVSENKTSKGSTACCWWKAATKAH